MLGGDSTNHSDKTTVKGKVIKQGEKKQPRSSICMYQFNRWRTNIWMSKNQILKGIQLSKHLQKFTSTNHTGDMIKQIWIEVPGFKSTSLALMFYCKLPALQFSNGPYSPPIYPSTLCVNPTNITSSLDLNQYNRAILSPNNKQVGGGYK